MARERKIVGIWPAGRSVEQDGAETDVEAPAVEAAASAAFVDAPPSDGADDAGQWYDAPLVEQRRFPLSSAIAALLLLGWTGWSAFVASHGLTRLPTAQGWYEAIAQFAMPAALILLGWLVVERGSARSAHRHLQLLGTLRQEQDQLADRLTVIGDTWRGAQHRLSAQGSALTVDLLDATQRIEQASATLESRMHAALATAGEVSEHGEGARRHMEGLILALPKVDETARRMSENLRAAGQNAYQYGGQLEERIAAIQAEAVDAERTLAASSVRLASEVEALAQAVSEVDNGAAAAGQRFQTTIAAQRDAALAMLADLAAQLDAQAEAGSERLATSRRQFQDASEAGAARLRGSCDEATAAASRLDEHLTRTAGQIGSLDEALSAMLGAAETRLATLDAQGRAGAATLLAGLESIRDRADAVAGQLAAGESNAARHVEQADAFHGHVERLVAKLHIALPKATGQLEADIDAGHQAADALHQRLAAGSSAAHALSGELAEGQSTLETQARLIGELAERTAQWQAEQAAALTAAHSRLDELAAAIGERQAAIDAVAARSAEALDTLSQAHGDAMASAIDAALARASGDEVDARLRALADRSATAVAAADAASVNLAAQLDAIARRSAALEAQATGVAGALDAQSGEHLARQVARTSEALQSTAVDLARLLSADVADQAWEAYLKGDRGVFARRTVRLLNAAEARAVLARYQADEDFRTLVNRYILDFETMLRSMLDTRDGPALSVTLLSSDVGKIYVALAQAIERLRH